ncbi:uncharacterized protein LOC142890627 isoform X2 [Nelusetta ayraudi]|uniref:uncharacterized protein LOC142890627 isoform X2 n=1 Tax=Nelusetta ayraudi TaxID=303726 RepID=UPI003F726EC0
MLLTVEYQGVKKLIKIPQIDENFDFQKFLQQVTDKFSLQAQLGTEGGIHLLTSDTEVDADTFDELIQSGVRDFKIVYRQCPENRKGPTEDRDHDGAKQKMLLTVEYQGVKKLIKIPQIDENFDFQKFLQQVTDKFSLQAQLGTEGGIHLLTSDTEVDADTFDELIQSGVRDFKIVYRQCPESSTSSPSSSDCTNIPSTTENRKGPTEDRDHDGAKQKTLDPVPSSPSSAATMTPTALSKFGHINNVKSMKQGPPTIYQLTPEPEMVGLLKKITIGKKNPNLKNKAILLLGETGTGKSTLINTLMNQALGVQWEDNVWFHFVENEQQSDGEQRNQADSQTSDVIVYQLCGFEGKPLPCSLTIIDTPGFGDTRGIDRDDIVKVRLLELFRSGEGVHEISAVGLVLKASENRVSDRLRYIFDSVMSLFGKDMEKNIVALLTHSDGLSHKNVLQALEEANVKLAKDEDNEPVCFLVNNCQDTQRTNETSIPLKAQWDMTMTQIRKFRKFIDNSPLHNVQKDAEVLETRAQLEAAIGTLMERIAFTQMKQKEIQQRKSAIQEMKDTYEVDEAYKDIVPISGGWWWFNCYFNGALTCSVCQENCHYPGCTRANSPGDCEIIKNGNCTSCKGKCPVSKHLKQEWIYVTKTRKVTEILTKVHEEKSSRTAALQKVEEKLREIEEEIKQCVEEAYGHILKLEKIALNKNSVSILVHLDFMIEKMKEKGHLEKVTKLEEIKERMDKIKGLMEVADYRFSKMLSKNAEK